MHDEDATKRLEAEAAANAFAERAMRAVLSNKAFAEFQQLPVPAKVIAVAFFALAGRDEEMYQAAMQIYATLRKESV